MLRRGGERGASRRRMTRSRRTYLSSPPRGGREPGWGADRRRRPAPRLRNLHQIASNCLPPRSFPDAQQSTARSTPSALTAAKPAAQGQGVADLDTLTDPAAELKSTTRPGPPASAALAPGGGGTSAGPHQTAPRTSGQRRDSQRPVLTIPRSIRPEFRNVLFGRVKARDTSEPEEDVACPSQSTEYLGEARSPHRRLRPVCDEGSRWRLDRERDHAQRPRLLRQPDHREQRPDHRRDRPRHSQPGDHALSLNSTNREGVSFLETCRKAPFDISLTSLGDQ